MQHITKSIFKKLKKRSAKSHKGDNGIVLIIAGSRLYHGAAIFAGVTASRLVDLVYFATAKENLQIIKKASPEFIVFEFGHIKTVLPEADSILIGPGLKKSPAMKNLVHHLLTKSKGKRFVLDATALRLINPKWLHCNCIVTPHANEFRHLFGKKPSAANTKAMAKKYNCIVVLKGAVDYISDGNKSFENKTGNAAMTAGGTGDVLAGLIVAFAAKNDLMLAAKAGCYLNGYTADLLLREKKIYNAQDLMEKIPAAMLRLKHS